MSTATLAQIAANQIDAQHPTGRHTEAGKAVSSRNALKTGLTGRTVLLPSDDADHYSRLVTGFFDEYKPSGDEEARLVQSLADSTWRASRIPALETGIYALGRLELKDCFPEESNPAIREQLIEAKIFLQYHRQLNNLSIQEARLHRQFDKDRKRLLELQEIRRREASQRLVAAAKAFLQAVETGKKAEFLAEKQAIGFEFSSQQIETAARQLRETQGRAAALSFPKAA